MALWVLCTFAVIILLMLDNNRQDREIKELRDSNLIDYGCIEEAFRALRNEMKSLSQEVDSLKAMLDEDEEPAAQETHQC